MKFVILDPKETKLFSNSHVSRIRDIIFLMFSPTYLLTTTIGIDVPLDLELDYGVPLKFFQGCIVAIGLKNIGGSIKEISNYLFLYFKVMF